MGNTPWVLDNLLSYLPNPLAERLLQQPGRPLLGETERYQAAVLFADLARFTPMTEALCRAGVEGAEQLTQFLNRYFSGQIAEVDRLGGIVGKFAGDAMTVLFRGPQAALRAVACAQALLQRGAEMATIQTLAGEFHLQMKLGLAYGEVLQFVAGNDRRQDFIFAGSPLDAAAQAEHRASPGDIVLDRSILTVLPPDRVEVEPLDEAQPPAFGRLLRLRGEVPDTPNPPLPAPSDMGQAIEALRPFLPPQSYEQILLGMPGFVNEHRQISVLFVNFEGINYSLPDASQQLGGYLQAFFGVVGAYDGTIRQVEMGDKGSKVIVLFGAPVAHENDEERALLCALDLQNLARDRGVITSQCIGITTGKAFCGNLGAPRRQEYAAMGDIVNLSARLMQAAAPGRILADESTWRGAGPGFAWAAPEKIQVKGKQQPITVFELQGRLHRRASLLTGEAYALPMVGRQQELRHLENLLEEVLQSGRGHVVGITAEAGMGKTRLAVEVILRAVQKGFIGLRGNGLSHGTTTPYLAWRPILRALLGLDEDRPIFEQQTQIEAALRRVRPDLTERLPLLGDVLGATFPDTELTASMDAKLRQESLFALVIDLVRAQVQQAPLLLVLEDAHWLDEVSRQLAQRIAALAVHQRIFFLTVYRPPAAGAETGLWDAPPQHFTEVRLAPFSSVEMRTLVRLKLGHVRLPHALMQKIETLSAGNPFFVDEFVSLIQDQGIDLSDVKALEALEVPNSIQTLIVTRLDQLAESEKMTLRVASVIGQLFRSQWLYAIYPGEIRQDLLQRDLDRVHSIGLVHLDKPAPELEYLFKHAITQEVIYGTLSFSNRRMLHERLGMYIEQAYAADLPAWYGILAYHYGRAERFEREYHFLVLAARQAAQQAAYRQAFELYSRAIALQEAHSLASLEEEFDLRLARVDLTTILSEYEVMQADVQAMQNLSPGLDPGRQAATLIALGEMIRHFQRNESPRPYYQQAIDLARLHGEKSHLLRGLYLLGGTYFGSGDYQTAKQILYQVIQEAGPAEWRQKAQAQQVLGWVVYDEADYNETERLWLEAYEIMRANHRKAGEAMLLSNLGALYSTLVLPEKAFDFYEQSLTLAIQLGYKTGEAEAARLLGDSLQGFGLYSQAWEALERSLAVAEYAAESTYVYAYGWTCMAEILLKTGGDLAEADRLSRQAFEITDPKLGIELAGWVFHTRARVLSCLGQDQQALDLLFQALEYRRQLGQIERLLPTLADIGLIYLKRGDLTAARQQVDEILQWFARPDAERFENLFARLACYQILSAVGETDLAVQTLRHAALTLQKYSDQIQSEQIRRAFLEAVPHHRQIREAYQALEG